jgi:hypothetical protein
MIETARAEFGVLVGAAAAGGLAAAAQRGARNALLVATSPLGAHDAGGLARIVPPLPRRPAFDAGSRPCR